MPGRTRSRYTTFLVSVTEERPGGAASSPTVYAVMNPSAEEAIAAVRPLADGSAALAIVGSLSTRVSKALKLKPGQPHAL
ncbi:hypothetical protein [Methylobacterium sp. NEAU K]|uniref:hypothetical protein n=1 Tax=Methylobacterium sp. NEAU K TaxID=3064946 RepID=UPI0027337609|nr:hypothetical protein [Methylobacterium sp. NEAU K]MDP4003946.1 hypothetical protein [Methylobacterium sp. NEAU K]